MRICVAFFIVLFLSYTPLHAGEADEGRQLFEVRCAGCHQLPEPGMLKPAQWRVVLETMQERMKQSGMPPLSIEEYEKVLTYVMANARSVP